MAKCALHKAIEQLQALAEKQNESVFVYPEFGDNRSYRLALIESCADLLTLSYTSEGESYVLDIPKQQIFDFSKTRLELRMLDLDGESVFLVAEE